MFANNANYYHYHYYKLLGPRRICQCFAKYNNFFSMQQMVVILPECFGSSEQKEVNSYPWGLEWASWRRWHFIQALKNQCYLHSMACS